MTPTFPRVTLPGVAISDGLAAAELMAAGKARNAERSALAYRFAVAMRRLGKPVYLGTVSEKTKADRRNGKAAAKTARRRARHAESVAKRSEWARRV